MTLEEELINRIVTKAAKELAKSIEVNERDVVVLIAEILASNYKQTGPGQEHRHGVFKQAEALATTKISSFLEDQILQDVEQA